MLIEFQQLIALAQSLQKRPEIARNAVRKLYTPELDRSDAFVLLCALAGENELLVNEIASHAYIRNYRWFVSERLLRPYRKHPPFQKLVREVYEQWQENLSAFGQRLPVAPPAQPTPEAYFGQQ